MNVAWQRMRLGVGALSLTLMSGLATACAGLVGEECAPGYIASGDVCVPGPTLVDPAGQGVFLGMDFSAIAPGSREAHLLGNAVFLSEHRPLRILDYRELTDWNSSSVTNVVDLIASEAIVRRRTLQTTVAESAADAEQQLTRGNLDVLFVHDQVDAPAGKLAEIGASWEPALSAFLGHGGVVVVLATAKGRNEMGQLLTASGLLSVSSLAPTTSAHITNVAPTDPVGEGVRTPLYGEEALAYFITDDTSGAQAGVVLAAATDEPVALHSYRPWTGGGGPTLKP